jgi:cobalamin biosynthesis protein CbiG
MNLRERYKALPRAGQWLIWFVAVLVGYFALVEPLLAHAAGVSTRADRLQSILDAQAKLAQERSQAGNLIERGLLATGLPNPPTPGGDPLGTLNRRVDRLARDHNITIKRRTERPNAPIPGNPEWNGQRLEQVGIEFVIDCDTPQLVAVLKDLESAPEVHAISQLRVQKISTPATGKDDPGLLSVTLLPVTWVLSREASK